jgi:hypothetical protein
MCKERFGCKCSLIQGFNDVTRSHLLALHPLGSFSSQATHGGQAPSRSHHHHQWSEWVSDSKSQTKIYRSSVLGLD